MSWTTAKDLRTQVQKLWDKGDLLRPLVLDEPFESPAMSWISGFGVRPRFWLTAAVLATSPPQNSCSDPNALHLMKRSKTKPPSQPLEGGKGPDRGSPT